MFELLKYKNWIRQEYFIIGTPESIIDAMSLFDKEPYKTLNKKTSKESSRFIKKYLNQELEKPTRVSLNRYLLFKFGYKYCNYCNNVKPLDSYANLNSRWDKKQIKCKDCGRDHDKNRYIQNKEEFSERYKKYYNDTKEVLIGKVRHWQNNNRDKVNSTAAKRRASKLRATPKWLTKQHWIEIEDIYWCAKETTRILGEPYEVDHIIPLLGSNVCGLHVPWNLQIISKKENCSKGNSFNE